MSGDARVCAASVCSPASSKPNSEPCPGPSRSRGSIAPNCYRAPGKPSDEVTMLIKLLRTYLRPYSTALIAVVGLQLVATMASLYLPSLNADIIDKGVAKGDTGYIL